MLALNDFMFGRPLISAIIHHLRCGVASVLCRRLIREAAQMQMLRDS